MFSSIGIGILGGRLAAMVGAGTNPLTHPADILLIRGGVSTAAATLAALGAWAFSVRKDLRRSSDLAAPAMIAGLAGWHAGCVFRNACAGTATDLPWAITLPGSAVGRHPVEVYTAAALIIAVVVLRRWPVGSGAVFGLGLGLAAAIRLTTEPFRASLGGGPIEWYVAGTIVGASIWLHSSQVSNDSDG